VTDDQPVSRQPPAQESTQNKRKETSLPRVGLEPTTPVFEQANVFHALDRSATLIGSFPSYLEKFKIQQCVHEES
jgi:hypothetical protein